MAEQKFAQIKAAASAPEGEAVPFPEEIAHLAEIERDLDEALREAQRAVERMDEEYMAEKRYLAQYRGELDPRELFQNELALKQIDSVGAFAVTTRDRLAKLRDSPYFARIDFRDKGMQEAAKRYIGRFAFSREDALLVCDWRSPVASLFYDCELGAAAYDAPAGRIEGELTRKRQFKIRDGRMEYALESSVHIQDEVLQRALSQTSDEKMKSIIATIQKEQHRVIRDEQAETLLIQGAAGSGKTSVALHRIAFLLYRQKDRLAAENVAILSPSRVFGDYIANVLPELGEQPVREWTLEDLARALLPDGIEFEPDRDPLDNQDERWAQRARFKSTLAFVEQLDRYLQALPQTVFAPEDCAFGSFAVQADWLQGRFAAYARDPVKQRLRKVAEDLDSRLQSESRRGEAAPKVGAILKRLQAMLRVKSALALYRAFYRQAGLSELLVMPAKRTLEWADVFPFLYLQAAFEEPRQIPEIRHLVVDEMQDYTPVQHALCKRLFACPKTLLGDFGQQSNPNHLHTLEDLRRLYGDAAFVELRKSYRSTCEILAFAKRVRGETAPEAFARHGEAPEVLPCADPKAQTARVRALLDAFGASGYASLAVLAKTERGAKALYAVLSQSHAVHLLSPQCRAFRSGISVAAVRMAKGLEFDAVVLVDADRANYATECDRNLLYIACTRAMHRLTLLYVGQISPLLG